MVFLIVRIVLGLFGYLLVLDALVGFLMPPRITLGDPRFQCSLVGSSVYGWLALELTAHSAGIPFLTAASKTRLRNEHWKANRS